MEVWAPAPSELDPMGSSNEADAPTESTGGVELEVSSRVDGLGRVDSTADDPEACELEPLPCVLAAGEEFWLLDPEPADCDVPA